MPDGGRPDRGRHQLRPHRSRRELFRAVGRSLRARTGCDRLRIRAQLRNEWTVRSLARFGVADVSEQFLYGNGWARDTYGDPTRGRRIWPGLTSPTTRPPPPSCSTTRSKGLSRPVTSSTGFSPASTTSTSISIRSSAPPCSARRRTSTRSNPVYGAPLTDPVSYLNQDLTQQQLGFYAQDQLRFGRGLARDAEWPI